MRRQIRSAQFISNGKTILTTLVDVTVANSNITYVYELRMWRSSDGKPVGEPIHPGGLGWQHALSPDGMIIASATGDDGQATRMWSTLSGAPIGKPMEHDKIVTACEFSPDGKLITTASSDRTVRLWSAADGTPIGKPLPFRGKIDGKYLGKIDGMYFAPDGKRLITCSDGNPGSKRSRGSGMLPTEPRSVRPWKISSPLVTRQIEISPRKARTAPTGRPSSRLGGTPLDCGASSIPVRSVLR